jgi:hypothetical protein
MNLSLRYPVYVIASRDGVVVVKTDGKDCIMLFHAKDPAEQQIEKIQSAHPLLGSLHALPVPNSEALREGLKELPLDVTCAVWDPTGTPAEFNHVCLDDLLLALST